MIAIPWYWKTLSLIGLFGLIILILIWNIQLATVQYVPLALELGLLLIPLLVLVRGVVQNSGKTFVYAILISLLYIIVGFLSTGAEPLYGYSMIIFSVFLYGGSFMCAKVISRYNKAIALQQQQEQGMV